MKVSSDPWEAILASIEPEYKVLKDVSAAGPTIRAVLFKKSKRWHIKLEEIWPAELYIAEWTFDSTKLDSTIHWTDNVLQTWSGSNRESWDTWSFNSKRDAEKFITYYNIACPQ